MILLIIYFKVLCFNYKEFCCLISNAFFFSVICGLPVQLKMTYTSHKISFSAEQSFQTSETGRIYYFFKESNTLSFEGSKTVF